MNVPLFKEWSDLKSAQDRRECLHNHQVFIITAMNCSMGYSLDNLTIQLIWQTNRKNDR